MFNFSNVYFLIIGYFEVPSWYQTIYILKLCTIYFYINVKKSNLIVNASTLAMLLVCYSMQKQSTMQ